MPSAVRLSLVPMLRSARCFSAVTSYDSVTTLSTSISQVPVPEFLAPVIPHDLGTSRAPYQSYPASSNAMQCPARDWATSSPPESWKDRDPQAKGKGKHPAAHGRVGRPGSRESLGYLYVPVRGVSPGFDHGP
ncbi:unnamed protein product [Cutaneotrichosporon oleaginosum]